MDARLEPQAIRRAGRPRRTAYRLVTRGPDGRPRSEHFADAASYHARLAALERSEEAAVTVDEILAILDA